MINNAQILMEEYTLKPRDAIHLASALKRNVEEFITFDHDFEAAKEIINYGPPY